MEIYIKRELIKKQVEYLAKYIENTFTDFTVICVLNGAFVFCLDLVRSLKNNPKINFLKASSYRGTKSTGKVDIQFFFDPKELEGKKILVVEDIIDTGVTFCEIKKKLDECNPKEMRSVSLLYKPDKGADFNLVNYVGFVIEDKFVVGYGLDYDGRYRELQDISIYKDE